MINCYSSADKKIMAEAISDSCIRLCVADTDDKECGLNRYSIYETLPSPDFSSQKNGENTVISVKNARLEVSPDGNFVFSDGDGRVLLSSKSIENIAQDLTQALRTMKAQGFTVSATQRVVR